MRMREINGKCAFVRVQADFIFLIFTVRRKHISSRTYEARVQDVYLYGGIN